MTFLKKPSIVAAALAALALSTTPAAASETGPPAGIRSCGPMQIGFVVWAYDPVTRTNQDLVEYCIPIGP